MCGKAFLYSSISSGVLGWYTVWKYWDIHISYFLHLDGLIPEELLGNCTVEQVLVSAQLNQEVLEELTTVFHLLVIFPSFLHPKRLTMPIFFSGIGGI